MTAQRGFPRSASLIGCLRLFAKPTICGFFLCVVLPSLSSQQQPTKPQRDPLLLEVLSRVLSVSGGTQALAAIHDMTEAGEITFHWGEGHKGPVTMQALGTNRFRMEADLPEGKRTWAVKAGKGSVKEPDGKVRPIPYDAGINLESLTFPLIHFGEALADPRTDIELVGIQKRDGHSVYCLRIKGQLGLTDLKTAQPHVVKDLLIDALTFNIVSIQDRPFEIHEAGGILSDKPSREIDYGDFRKVDGVLVPFAITTKLMGQATMSISLSNVVFNGNLSDSIFQN